MPTPNEPLLPSDMARHGPTTTANVLPFPSPPAPASDVVAHVIRLQAAAHSICLDMVAGRIDWLASGVALWPDILITREHILTQLRTLADGVRQMRSPPPAGPAPTKGDAA